MVDAASRLASASAAARAEQEAKLRSELQELEKERQAHEFEARKEREMLQQVLVALAISSETWFHICSRFENCRRKRLGLLLIGRLLSGRSLRTLGKSSIRR